MPNSRRRTYSLLCPTRGRPDWATRLVRSIIETSRYGFRVEILFYVDNDDPQRDAYIDAFSLGHEKYPSLRHGGVHIGPHQSVSLSWNIIAAAALGDVLLMANDDQIYRTVGWDVKLDEVIAQYPDDIFCVWFNDGINGDRHCAFPIISRRWYETLGYFTPGIFKFMFNDTWVWDIAKRLDRAHYIDDVLVEHMHWSVNKSKPDATTTQWSETYGDDANMFGDSAPMRRQHAEKLRALMNG